MYRYILYCLDLSPDVYTHCAAFSDSKLGLTYFNKKKKVCQECIAGAVPASGFPSKVHNFVPRLTKTLLTLLVARFSSKR